MAHHRIPMREARQNAGLSQQGLADRLGVHQPDVARWESGRVMPRVDTALRLAAALGTTVEALWSEPKREAG
jgi:transcriptional regulator with XRE-family HTH domain